MNFAKTHLTTQQLAERWGMHPVALSNWRTKGKGPKFVKIGGRIYYPEKLILEMELDVRSSTADSGSRGRKTDHRK